MKFLLDTCVISGLRQPNDSTIIKNSLKHIEAENLFISVITIGELAKGIALLPSSKRKTALTHWAMDLEHHYKDRILSIHSEIMHIWGEITAQAQLTGKTIPIADGLIAATALAHGLHIMTRNTLDFEYTGALLFNPWINEA